MKSNLREVLFDLSFANPHDERKAFSTAEVACAIRCCYPPNSSITPVLVAEEGTVASRYAEEIKAHLGDSRRIVIHGDLETSELAHLTFDEIAHRCTRANQSLVGVIAWEPHTNWMRGRDPNTRDVLLQFSDDSKHPLPSFTFDLVGSRDDAVDSVMLRRLVEQLWTLVEEQRAFQPIRDPYKKLLRKYFSFAENENLTDGFKRIRYCVYPRGGFWFGRGGQVQAP